MTDRIGRRFCSLFVPALAVSVLLAGCEPATDDDMAVEEPLRDAEPVMPADTADDRAEMTEQAQLDVAQQDLYGDYLVDGEGRTLYMFTADTQGESSACYDDCAQAWPPLLTSGDPAAEAPGLNEDMLGTIERRDGSMQVTYNGWPLYYFQQDTGPGQVAGQDVAGSGGEWYLVSPEGERIEEAAG